MKTAYAHLVNVDKNKGHILIDRIYDDGRKEYYTFIDVKEYNIEDFDDYIGFIAKKLGEILILDSPQARFLLKL